MASGQNLRILIQASLNRALSRDEINKAILAISNDPKLEKIKIKIDIDSKILDTLTTFNKNINQITQSTKTQTQAVNEATEAQKRLNLERLKTVKDAQGNVKRVTETYGNGVNQKIIDTKTVNGGVVQTTTEIVNQKKMLEEAKKIDAAIVRNANETAKVRKAIADKATQDENKRYNDFVAIKKKEYEAQKKLQADSVKLLAAQNKAELQVANLNRRYGSGVDSAGLNSLLSQMKSLDPKLASTRAETARLTNEIAKIGANAQSSAGHILNFGEAIRSSLTKMSAFMIGGTLIAMPIQGLKEAVSTIVQVDSQMTELKKVMDSDTDYNKIMSDSVKITDELGRSITSVLDAAVGFARSGFNEEQTIALARTAVLAQNISELSSEDAMSSITAAMTIFNIEASKSIRIIDSLNEVDNNYAITTKNLALSLNKAGSTAKTFGVTMEEMIGHTTAIGVATRESGAIVGMNIAA